MKIYSYWVASEDEAKGLVHFILDHGELSHVYLPCVASCIARRIPGAGYTKVLWCRSLWPSALTADTQNKGPVILVQVKTPRVRQRESKGWNRATLACYGQPWHFFSLKNWFNLTAYVLLNYSVIKCAQTNRGIYFALLILEHNIKKDSICHGLDIAAYYGLWLIKIRRDTWNYSCDWPLKIRQYKGFTELRLHIQSPRYGALGGPWHESPQNG